MFAGMMILDRSQGGDDDLQVAELRTLREKVRVADDLNADDLNQLMV